MHIYINLNCIKLELEKYCQDKTFEACAIKAKVDTINICIIALYRAPSGNFKLFISKLDNVLKKVYAPTLECIVCGDINIDYLTDNDRKSWIDALLKSCNLTSVVNFPARIQKTSVTTIDNIFIDTTKMRKYSVSPVINGLSDHDSQLITIHTHNLRSYAKKYMLIRQINDHTINYFLTKLSCELWDGVSPQPK